MLKKLYLYLYDIIDTAFSYERELTVCSFLQDFSNGKGSNLQLICNAHTAFLLCGAELVGEVEVGLTLIMYCTNVDMDKQSKIRV